jgi:hypothetical protein
MRSPWPRFGSWSRTRRPESSASSICGMRACSRVSVSPPRRDCIPAPHSVTLTQYRSSRTRGHGDHSDLVISKPRVLIVRFNGPKLSHVDRGGDSVAVFFDGDGSSRVFKKQDLVEGRTGKVRRIESGAAHHGVTKPVGRQIAITVPAAEGGLPNAVELRGANGKASQRLDCPRLTLVSFKLAERRPEVRYRCSKRSRIPTCCNW